MGEQGLRQLVVGFLTEWKRFVIRRESTYQSLSFHDTPMGKLLKEQGIIADHENPQEGEYAIHYEYTGTAFFLRHGELAFTETGLPFAKKCAELMSGQGWRIQVIKIVACYSSSRPVVVDA